MQNNNYYPPPPPPPAQQQPYYGTNNNPKSGAGVLPPPVTHNVPPPTTQNGCFRTFQPQFNVVCSASFIFISGGMNIAACNGGSLLFSILSTTHLRISWFIGGCIGAIITALIAKFLPNKIINQAAALLIIIDGIILAATRYRLHATIAAHYLDGIANGLVFAPTMALVGEVSDKSRRGTIAAFTEQLAYSFGIFLFLLILTFWGDSLSYSFSPDELRGIISIVLGLASLLAATFLTVESPIKLLSIGHEYEATEGLRRLQPPFVVNTETLDELEEQKRYLYANSNLSTAESVRAGLPALLRLCIYRGVHAMGVSWYVLFTLSITSYVNTQSLSAWPHILFGIVRLVGAVLVVALSDRYGRKPLGILGFLVAAGMAFGVAPNLEKVPLMEAALVFLLVHQLFVGMASSVSSIYLAEAFPLTVKHVFLSITYMVEMLAYLIIVCFATFSDLVPVRVYFYFLGGFSFGCMLLVLFCLPETKLTTLREAQQKFESFISFR